MGAPSSFYLQLLLLLSHQYRCGATTPQAADAHNPPVNGNNGKISRSERFTFNVMSPRKRNSVPNQQLP
jgi:hypothetical protein